jgi:hypothetical protein
MICYRQLDAQLGFKILDIFFRYLFFHLLIIHHTNHCYRCLQHGNKNIPKTLPCGLHIQVRETDKALEYGASQVVNGAIQEDGD